MHKQPSTYKYDILGRILEKTERDTTLTYNYQDGFYHPLSSSLSTSGSICVGNEEFACAGLENGYGLYWDAHGNSLGATAYLEAYAEVASGLGRASGGIEAGFLGMESRGLYAGANIAGIHAEYTQNRGWNWNLSGSIYYGVTNEGNGIGVDGEHREVSRLLWIPELGNYGKFKLGASYDVTNQGIQEKQIEKILALVKLDETIIDVDNKKTMYDLLSKEFRKSKFLSKTTADLLNKWMLNNGYKRVNHLNLMHKGEKRTYAKGFGYGNIELIQNGDGYYFSSYNYGNNLIDHFFLDMVGYFGTN